MQPHAAIKYQRVSWRAVKGEVMRLLAARRPSYPSPCPSSTLARGHGGC